MSIAEYNASKPKLTDQEYFDRFRGRCIENEKGCWLWQGSKNELGYAQVTVRGRSVAGQRFMWSVKSGKEMPRGIQACHTCDEPSCINPYHVFPGTASDNARDAQLKGRHFTSAKTHCKRGHPLSGDNVYLWKNRRSCKLCQRAKLRMRHGWPMDLAFSAPATSPGYVIVKPEDRQPTKAPWNKTKQHCIRGHELSGDNLYIVKRTGHRQCRKCRHEVVKRIQSQRMAARRSIDGNEGR